MELGVEDRSRPKNNVEDCYDGYGSFLNSHRLIHQSNGRAWPTAQTRSLVGPGSATCAPARTARACLAVRAVPTSAGCRGAPIGAHSITYSVSLCLSYS